MARTERSGHTTVDHDFIRGWVEERGGWPARVKGTEGKDDAGLIRIDFPGYSGGDSLERIEWEDWFRAFDDNRLALLHRDLSYGGGDLDRFNKLVRRSAQDRGRSTTRGRAAAKKATGTRATKTGTRATKTGARATTTARTRSTGESSARKSRPSGTRRTSAGGTRRTATRPNGRSSSANGTEPNGMRDLLLHELGDLLYAERRFLQATRTMAREAQEPHLRARIEEHVEETQGQIKRLQEAFRAVGERPRAVTCEGADGLKEEHASFKREEKPSSAILSAFDLGSGLRVEHYEIAGYKSAIAIANALGEKDCAGLLKESLREETAMASFLEKNAPLALRRVAAEEAGQRPSLVRRVRDAVGV